MRLPDVLRRGHLRGFAFAPDSESYYYVHEAPDAKRPLYRAAYQQAIGTPFSKDREIFYAGDGPKIRLSMFGDESRLVFFVYRFEEQTLTEVYVKPFKPESAPELICGDAEHVLGFHFSEDKTLVLRIRRTQPANCGDALPGRRAARMDRFHPRNCHEN